MLMISEQLITVLTASTGLRAELLDATVRLLNSRDVAGLTTREIAREAASLMRVSIRSARRKFVSQSSTRRIARAEASRSPETHSIFSR